LDTTDSLALGAQNRVYKSWGVRGIPDGYNVDETRHALASVLKVSEKGADLDIHSLASSHLYGKVATVSFKSTPFCLSDGKTKWIFDLPRSLDDALPNVPSLLILISKALRLCDLSWMHLNIKEHKVSPNYESIY
jgi:hypothetical protein